MPQTIDLRNENRSAEEAPDDDERADDDAQEIGTLLSWEAFDFERDPQARQFLIYIGAALAIGGLAAIFFGNFLFAALLLISGGLIAAQAYREPKLMHFAVTSRGVKIARRLYEYDDLKSFWLSYDPPLFKELVVTSKKTLMPLVRVPLGNLDPLPLREILLRFLPEVKYEESVIDIISKRLGF